MALLEEDVGHLLIGGIHDEALHLADCAVDGMDAFMRPTSVSPSGTAWVTTVGVRWPMPMPIPMPEAEPPTPMLPTLP